MSETKPVVSLDRAAALLAEIEVAHPFPVDPLIRDMVINHVAGLFGVDLDRVRQILDFSVEEERRFRIHDGQVAIRIPEDGGPFEVALGTVDKPARVAVLLHPSYINRSQQFRSDVISSTEIADCRAWLELKGYQVTENDS